MLRQLNIGCGHDDWGSDRLDLIKTPTTTKVHNINKGLPYPDNYFDEVRCRAVLEHVKNIGTLADECYRVMKPEAKLFIRTDNAGYIFFHISKKHEHNAWIDNQYKSHDYKHSDDEDAHYHLFVPSNLHKLFKKFRLHSVKYHYGGRNKLVTFCLKCIPFKMGAIQFEVNCTK